MLAVGFVGGDSDCIVARTAVCFTFPRGPQVNSVGKIKNNTGRFLVLLFVPFNFFSGSLMFFCILKQTYQQTQKAQDTEIVQKRSISLTETGCHSEKLRMFTFLLSLLAG